MVTWNSLDEAHLQELLERKAQATREREVFVFDLVEGLFYRDRDSEEIAQELMKRATQVREILKPFDATAGGVLK